MIEVWDARTLKQVLSLRGHMTPTASLAWSPDGRRLASLDETMVLKMWDTTKPQGHTVLAADRWPVSWSPDRKSLLTIATDGSLTILDTSGTTAPRTFLGPDKTRWRNGAWSPDGKQLAVTDVDKNDLVNVPTVVRIYDVAKGNELKSWEDPADPVKTQPAGWFSVSISFSPDGKQIAWSDRRGTIRVRDVGTGQIVTVLITADKTSNYTVAPVWSPDGRFLLGMMGETVRLWDTSTWQALAPIVGTIDHSNWFAPRNFAWSPDGHAHAITCKSALKV
jgi:WD40 repeat protein